MVEVVVEGGVQDKMLRRLEEYFEADAEQYSQLEKQRVRTALSLYSYFHSPGIEMGCV